MISFQHSTYYPSPSFHSAGRQQAQGRSRTSTPPRPAVGTPAPGVSTVNLKPLGFDQRQPISFEKALKELHAFASSNSSTESTHLSLNISPSVCDQITDNLVHYPELNNLRFVHFSCFLTPYTHQELSFDYRQHDMLLIVQLPNVGHELMAELEAVLSEQKPDDVKFGGTALTSLSNGKKSPDFCMFSDRNPDRSKRFQKFQGTEQILGDPTVVIEVAYSEKESDLAEDCGRWIACSFGHVRLAIGIKIDYDLKTDSTTHELERNLTGINCFTWQLEKVEANTTLLRDEKIDILRRTDDSPGPATRFSCVSRVGPTLYRLHSFCRQTYQVWPYHLFDNRSYNIFRCILLVNKILS